MNMRIFFENTAGRGEDAGIVGENYAIVFDGLGGTGGMRCRNAAGETRTEAKVASNAAAQAVEAAVRENWSAWSERMKAAQPKARKLLAQEMAGLLKRAIDKQLAYEMTRWTHDANKRYMPTTMAGWITFPQENGKLIAVAIWAGDSRCYMIDSEYMRQVSKDDSYIGPGEDVMTEILSQESPRMSNTICVDKPYRLNVRCVELDRTALLFSCTDGMYNSLPSPMHLEYYMRLGFGESQSMRDVQEALSSFISRAIMVKDDSCTVCAKGFVPGTNSFEALAEAMLAPVNEFDKAYIENFPDPPALPDGEDADGALRKLAKQLSTMPSFVAGVNAYIERMGNTPDEPVGKQPGSELINDLRGRRENKRYTCEERLHECDQRIGEAENRLRQCVSSLKCTRVVSRKVGDQNFSAGWYRTLCTEESNVNFIFEVLNGLHQKMYRVHGDGYAKRAQYNRPTERDVTDAAPFLRDLVVLLNNIKPMEGVYTSYMQNEVTEEPLNEAQCSRIVTALLGDAPLTDAVAPDVRMTFAQMEAIARCRETIREWKQKRAAIVAEADYTVKLTDEDREKISTNYILMYARDMLREWYKTHAKPAGIEMSDKLIASVEKQLERCWSIIDRGREEYKRAYEEYKAQIMALWAKYQPNYVMEELSEPEEAAKPVQVIVEAPEQEPEVKAEPAPAEEPVQQPVPSEPEKAEIAPEMSIVEGAWDENGQPIWECVEPETVTEEPGAPEAEAPKETIAPEAEDPYNLPPDYVLEGRGENYAAYYYSMTSGGRQVEVTEARWSAEYPQPKEEAKHRETNRSRLGGTWFPKGDKRGK